MQSKFCNGYVCYVIQISCEGEVVKGQPSSWIIDECNRIGADIVAVGSSQAGFIKRSLLHMRICIYTLEVFQMCIPYLFS
jgi:nucleotide-binding universal stress UspA family protein